MPGTLYKINPDRNSPWNDLPLLPINKDLYQTTAILEKLGEKRNPRKILEINEKKNGV